MWHLKIVICSYFKWGVLRVRMCNPGLIILLILANFSNALNFYDDCGIDKARPMLEKPLSFFKTLHHLSLLPTFGRIILHQCNENFHLHHFCQPITKQQTIQKLSAVMPLVERCIEVQRTMVRRKAGRKVNSLDLFQLEFAKNSSVICKVLTRKIPNK